MIAILMVLNKEEGVNEWRGRHKPGRKDGTQRRAVWRTCSMGKGRQQGHDPSGTMKMRSSRRTKLVGSVRAGARVTATQRCAEWSGRNAIKSVTP